ncbi:MAG: methyltransferase domain-containing protein [Alphaproteobacteria bacterium]|nr:methyltransferase domain-containing protein [Alphaproteobacteria bacterium]
MIAQFVHITELAGTAISSEQLQRMVTRYVWAADYCTGKDVLEVACGSGQGLHLLQSRARSLKAGDYSEEILAVARRNAPDVEMQRFDAQELPYPDSSIDVIIIFEALYYVPDPNRFFAEARRVLRPGGHLLIATANKDLFDFNPSPHSHHYLGVRELSVSLESFGFTCDFFGDTPTDSVSLRQRILRPVKYVAVRLGLMPKTADGKLWLKRLVFGRMIPMPQFIDETSAPYVAPTPIARGKADIRHKVVLCAAQMTETG